MRLFSEALAASNKSPQVYPKASQQDREFIFLVIGWFMKYQITWAVIWLIYFYLSEGQSGFTTLEV